MATNLMSASNQWATRPIDERFWGLEDLRTELQAQRTAAREVQTDIHGMKAVAHGKDICLAGGKNVPSRLTHWSFGQLAGLCKAPANYLRQLPINLALPNLNYGLSQLGKDNSKAKLLLHKNGNWLVRAITTPTYGRIWNLDVVEKLMPALQNGWMVPPARPAMDDPRARPATAKDIIPGQDDFGLSVKVGDMIAPAGIYAGDRDMFLFLVNPKRIIDDGNKGLMRGVFIRNSEVGASSFRMRTFYLENVCGNHIVWGASNIREIRIVHKKGSIVGFDARTLAKLREYANQTVDTEEGVIRKARTIELGKTREGVIEKLFSNKKLNLSKKDIEGAYEYAQKWEHTALCPPNTIWGMVHGITRYSQQFGHADVRQHLDNSAGLLLALAA